MTKTKKIMLTFLIILFLFGIIVFSLFFIGSPPQAKEIKWGVSFSQKHAQNLGLDWKESYSALLDDLGVKNLKVSAQWDLIEFEKDEYFFEDLDWQIKEAEKKGAKLLLVIGMKTGRWPECHIPEWAQNLSKEEQQKRISALLEEIVLRYKDSSAVKHWQIENEPFFPFGVCPWVDKSFLKEEIELVKSLDSQRRQVVVTDSGEGSFWINAAKFGDVAGTTMYRKVWFSFSWLKIKMPFLPEFLKDFGFYIKYPLPPQFYWQKAQIVKKLFNKKVICVEFQAEPWGPKLLYDTPLSEQEKTMNPELFRKNIEFAEKTGFDEFYLWGAEWMYWMKEKQNQPEIWNEAKKLFTPYSNSENL